MAMPAGLARLGAALGAAILASACGGGGGSPSPMAPVSVAPPPAPPPPAPSPAPSGLDFSALRAPIEAANAPNILVLVGDETGILFQYEKGDFDLTRQTDVGSASKLITGLGLWQLVEDGRLTEASQPQQFISFWTSIAGDGRSAVTLGQLMSFTSGFNSLPTDPTCIGNGALTLTACVRQIYDEGIKTPLPGSSFFYGPDHMQIAALMAEGAAGTPFTAHLQTSLLNPLGVSQTTRFPLIDGSNPRFAGALISTPEDYAKVLTAVLAGRVVKDRTAYLRDRIAGLPIEYRPEAVALNGFDWHYGFGFWKECDLNRYSASCDADPVISSPGAFGFTPWIDFGEGYWGIIAIEERPTRTFEPSSISVQLEQTLQPLIDQALP